MCAKAKIVRNRAKDVTMRKCIVSIDVGVKNLAICVLAENGSEDGKTIPDILFWKCYDVTKTAHSNDEDKVKKTPPKRRRKTNNEQTEISAKPAQGVCQTVVKKTNRPCGKKGLVNGRGRAYCGKHDPSKRHTPQDTQEWCHCMLTALPAIGEDLLSTLRTHATSYDDIVRVLQVIIEQQAIDNKKILLQSHLIFGHFVSLFRNEVPVRFVPAYNKLLVYQGPEIPCSLKTPYAQRKYMARKHTEHFLDTIRQLQRWREFFDSCRTKQDDISDAFLQGLYVIRKDDTILVDTDATGKRKRRRRVRF